MTTAIVAGVVGFLVLILSGVGLLWFCKSRRKKTAQVEVEEKEFDRLSARELSLLGTPRRPEPLEITSGDFTVTVATHGE